MQFTIGGITPFFYDRTHNFNFKLHIWEFKTDVFNFITAMGQEIVSENEFVKADEHKSCFLINFLDMEEVLENEIN